MASGRRQGQLLFLPDGTERAWGRAAANSALWPTPRGLRSLALASLGQERFSGERGRDEKGRVPITPQAGPGSHEGGGCTGIPAAPARPEPQGSGQPACCPFQPQERRREEQRGGWRGEEAGKRQSQGGLRNQGAGEEREGFCRRAARAVWG